MEDILHTHHAQIAGVIVEPLLQGAGGMLVYPAAYLQRLRQLTEELGLLLIYDEVATGFGRTGPMFAFERAQAVPDILCLAKALTAGYLPLALTITTDQVYDAFYDDYFSGKTLFHGHTYTGHPMACAAAVESLKIMAEAGYPQSKASVLDAFHERLLTFAQYDFIGDIRHMGFIGAVDVVKSRASREKYNEKLRLGFRIYKKSLEHGLVLRPLGDTIYWFLPQIVTRADVDVIMEKSHAALAETIAEVNAMESRS
jgi:adenosylmethionine-8-amino-7-oxononanoate aminotransferase